MNKSLCIMCCTGVCCAVCIARCDRATIPCLPPGNNNNSVWIGLRLAIQVLIRLMKMISTTITGMLTITMVLKATNNAMTMTLLRLGQHLANCQPGRTITMVPKATNSAMTTTLLSLGQHLTNCQPGRMRLLSYRMTTGDIIAKFVRLSVIIMVFVANRRTA